MAGFIKLYRSINTWGWRHKPNTFSVFLYLLTNANYEQNTFEGRTIKRGQLAVSLDSIARATGISIQSVRTSLKHLKSTNEITITSTNKYSIISITKYTEYQDIDKQPNNQSTNKQQTTNNNKEGKKGRIKKLKIKKPENVSEQTWNDFVAHRENKKAEITETVLDSIVRESEKVNWSLEEALKEMIIRNWQGFKAEWVKRKENQAINGMEIAL